MGLAVAQAGGNPCPHSIGDGRVLHEGTEFHLCLPGYLLLDLVRSLPAFIRDMIGMNEMERRVRKERGRREQRLT